MQVTFVACVAHPYFQYIRGKGFASISFHCDEHAERQNTTGHSQDSNPSCLAKGVQGKELSNVIWYDRVDSLHFGSHGNNSD